MFNRRRALRPVSSPFARGRLGGWRMLAVALSGALLLPSLVIGSVAAKPGPGPGPGPGGTASLTVTKVCLPSGDGGSFNLRIDNVTRLANAACGASTTVTVKTGKHTVTETAGAGTNLANYSAVIGGACAANGSVTLAANQSKTCTITNTRKPTLTVNKICVPDPDPGRFDLLIDGHKKGVDDVDCATGGNRTTGPVALTIGAHRIGEQGDGATRMADYTATYGGDCSAQGTITLAAGDSKTCTITNTRRATNATLTIEKICDPTDDQGTFNLFVNSDRVGADITCGGDTGAVTLPPGPYTVSEAASGQTDPLTYAAGVIGGDCAGDSTITLVAGENATCTITNSRLPTLKVTKVCDPVGAAGAFQLQVNGPNLLNTLDVICGADQSFTVSGPPGDYTVSETHGLLTDLSNYDSVISGDCDPTLGTIHLAYGDHKTCTITNSLKPTLTVTKICLTLRDGGVFDLLIDADESGDIFCGNSFTEHLAVGTHTVSEQAGSNTDLAGYTSVIGGDCDPTTHAVSLAYGDAKTCTITNTLKPASLVLDATVFPVLIDTDIVGYDWGSLTGSGLQPGASVDRCEGGVCSSTGLTVDGSGNLSLPPPEFSCSGVTFPVYFKTLRSSGAEIDSNVVSASPCP